MYIYFRNEANLITFVQTFMGFSPSKSKRFGFEILALLNQIQENQESLDEMGDVSVHNESLESSNKGSVQARKLVQSTKDSSGGLREELLLVSRNKNSKIKYFHWIPILHCTMAYLYSVIVLLNRNLFDSVINDSKAILGVVDRIFSTMHISTFMESATLTAMSRPFELYYTFPIMFAIGPFYRGTAGQWSRGVEAIFQNFKIEDSVSTAFKEVYQNNSCELFDRIKNSALIGTEKKKCSEIYGGIFERNFGLGMTKHFNTMDSIRAKFDYYIRTPVPIYQGESVCDVPA